MNTRTSLQSWTKETAICGPTKRLAARVHTEKEHYAVAKPSAASSAATRSILVRYEYTTKIEIEKTTS
jgi:hypothetical protein